MELNQENKVEFEKGGDAAVGDGMEAGDESEQVIVEEMEVYPIPRRKDEPLYGAHEKQLLAICPGEIWEHILGQLNDDPDAQTNCANASPYFWELLKKDRVLFLFPKVMEVVAPKTNKRRVGMYLETADNEYVEAEEHDFWTKEDTEDLRASILKCRLVCSTWNMAVEHCFQSTTMAGIQQFTEGNVDPRSTVRRMASNSWTQDFFRFENLDDIQNFMEKFQERHFSSIAPPPKNPIFGRWLSILMFQEENNKDRITEVLELCGKDVWYCSMDCWNGFLRPTGEEMSSELTKWLILLPNLRYLSMRGPVTLKNLSNDFQVNPIPKLEKLEILFLYSINGLLLNEMLRVNDHVKVLKMSHDGYSKDVELEVWCGLSNLTYFSMGSISGNEMLELCGHQWKQLNKLHLDDASKYFGKLESNWANTLTELGLKHPFGYEEKNILEKSKNVRLKLPGIRLLSLWMDGMFYLDFVTPMKGSLEHLEIHVNLCEDSFETTEEQKRVKMEESIELVGFEEKMHKSNVWKYFGKLETIQIKTNLGNWNEFFMFSREGKKYLCKLE